MEVDWTADSHVLPEEPSPQLSAVLNLIAALQREFAIDDKRIYITGLSMGGYGVWDALSRWPELFAGAVPICGGGDPVMAKQMMRVPIWAFHGADDKTVKVQRSREMIEAIKERGGDPKYTEYPGVAHNSWDAHLCRSSHVCVALRAAEAVTLCAATRPGRDGSPMMAVCSATRRNERRRLEQLPREELARHQLARLNELLREIVPHNRFYAEKFARVDATAADVARPAWPASLHVQGRAGRLRRTASEFAANLTYPLERYVRYHHTSGTRGRPMPVLDTAEDWQWWIECWQFVLDAAEVGPEDRALLAFSFGPFIGFWSAHDALVARGGAGHSQRRHEHAGPRRADSPHAGHRAVLHAQLCPAPGRSGPREPDRPGQPRRAADHRRRRAGRLGARRCGGGSKRPGTPG